jgi:hypothetical protein
MCWVEVPNLLFGLRFSSVNDCSIFENSLLENSGPRPNAPSVYTLFRGSLTTEIPHAERFTTLLSLEDLPWLYSTARQYLTFP